MAFPSIKRAIKKLLIKSVLEVLKDPQVQGKLWQNLHRPGHGAKPGPEDVWLNAWHQAGLDSARYVINHMLASKATDGRLKLFDFSLDNVNNGGLFLEFGVGHEATSINYLAKRINGLIHGFDSFQGLPEAWFGEFGKGSLSSEGALPGVTENVVLHVGWFDESLPKFLKENEGDIAFMHIDCDLYSSTKTVLECLRDRIVSGTVIQFDEYFNYPGWQQHEYKAFKEFISSTNLTYKYLGYDSKHFSVAVKIL